MICGDKSKHQQNHPETVYDGCETCRERIESVQMDARLDGYQAGFRDAVEAAAKMAEADNMVYHANPEIAGAIRELKPEWERRPEPGEVSSCPGCEALRREIAEKEKWFCRWLHSYRGSLSESLVAVIRTEESLRHSEKCIDPIIKELWDRGIRP